ncbi:hypothetical protein BGW38_001208 [Lunasporangiospora selenospora]|uniref:Apoptogenic protein 1, mitochondrial n=1 Tax=Lunasporangiospora selenospora TaxID=979761 RepID=A0A9P6G2M3_9FUNG|nr:hypothetical protein BGW38_001208 [Lunasporangiospora selenospora]
MIMHSLRRSAPAAFRGCQQHVSSRSFTASTTVSSAANSDSTASGPDPVTRKRENLNPALNTDKFLVGTPHAVSNLRPVKYPIPVNESLEDKLFRERCERVDAFNQNFWASNNALFNKAKADYEQKISAQNGGQPVTTEELSLFYKDFLDKAYERQMSYNRQWWIENMGLLLPAAKAAFRRWTSRSP